MAGGRGEIGDGTAGHVVKEEQAISVTKRAQLTPVPHPPWGWVFVFPPVNSYRLRVGQEIGVPWGWPR